MATLFYVCCRVISRVETFKYVTFAGARATLSCLFLRNTICSRRVSIEWFCQMCYKLCNWKPRTRLVQLNARMVQLTLTSVGEVKNSPHARFFPSLPRVSPNILHRRPGCRLPWSLDIRDSDFLWKNILWEDVQGRTILVLGYEERNNPENKNRLQKLGMDKIFVITIC